MADGDKLIEPRLSVVRDYLQSKITHCRILDGPASLIVLAGRTSLAICVTAAACF